MAAVLAAGQDALLSHRSAAALWGIARQGKAIEVTARHRRRRVGLRIYGSQWGASGRTVREGIPVTSLERTLLDLASVLDEAALRRAFEEADRLYLLDLRALQRLCGTCGNGRRGSATLRRIAGAALAPAAGRSELESRFEELCRAHSLPSAATNVSVLGHEVDALWPAQKLVVELDGFAFHGHRAAFERDRARDAALQAAGYRVLRLTHRRLRDEPGRVAEELRRLLAARGGERGQSTVEWVALLLVVALLWAALFAAGVRVPGAALAQAVASRLLCAAALADGCGDEPALIAAYGTEVGKLVREHMPAIFFERGSKALPVDFRRCRSSVCGDGSQRGLVHRSDAGLPVTAFVHVVDCRPDAASVSEAAGADCSGPRAGYLYLQFWLYYADSATLRPIIGSLGYHHDDWESVQIRIGPDGETAERASSHEGYNHNQGAGNWGSDAGIVPLKVAAEALGVRPHNGWGAETHALLVSGGSHAGNADGIPRADRLIPGRRVHLIPLEPLVAAGGLPRFAITPPWRKHVWRDPEAEGTN